MPNILNKKQDEENREIISDRSMTGIIEPVSEADYFLNAKIYDKALDIYNKILQENPKNKYVWNKKASLFEEQENYEEALKCYDEALKIDKNYQRAVLNKGLRLDILERYTEALKCYNEFLKTCPNSAKVWLSKGNALSGMKKNEKALECYDKALKIGKNEKIETGLMLGYNNRTATYQNKGFTLSNLGEYEKAIECFDSSLRLLCYDESSPMLENFKKWNIYNNPFSESEKEDLQDYLSFTAMAFHGKAEAYEKIGNHQEALVHSSKTKSLYEQSAKLRLFGLDYLLSYLSNKQAPPAASDWVDL